MWTTLEILCLSAGVFVGNLIFWAIMNSLPVAVSVASIAALLNILLLYTVNYIRG